MSHRGSSGDLDAGRDDRLWLRRAVSPVGLALHVALAYVYGVSGLVVPAAVLAGLWVVWATLFGVVVANWGRPAPALLAPVAAAAVWVAVVPGLGSLLRWSP